MCNEGPASSNTTMSCSCHVQSHYNHQRELELAREGKDFLSKPQWECARSARKFLNVFFTLIKGKQPLKSTPNRSKIAKKMISAYHTKKILITLNSQTHPPPPGGGALDKQLYPWPRIFTVIRSYGIPITSDYNYPLSRNTCSSF